MADLLVQGLDDALVQALKQRAWAHGRSQAAELRAILAAALLSPPRRKLADLLEIEQALAQAQEAKGAGARAAAVRVLRGTLANPLPWAIALGAASSAIGIRLAGPPDVIVRSGFTAAIVCAVGLLAVVWRIAA